MTPISILVSNIVLQFAILIVIAALAIYKLDQVKKIKARKGEEEYYRTLKKYIREHLSKGYNKKQVRKWLSDVSIEEEKIEQAFKLILNEEIGSMINVVEGLKKMSPHEKYNHLVHSKGHNKEVVGFAIDFVHFRKK